jgi:hypothetical protein
MTPLPPLPLLSCRRLAALLLAVPLLVQAHPGHEGDHGLTWDLTAVGPADAVSLLALLGISLLAAVRLGTLRQACSKLARVAGKVRGAR